MSRRSAASGAVLALALTLISSSLRGQNFNASVTGMVTDPSGAAVPDAQLTLRSLATGVVVQIASGPDGSYAFRNLLPGMYELKVSAKGFRDYAQSGIELTIGESARQDVKLQLGTSVQTVEVIANVTPLNTSNGELKGSITLGVLKDMPLEVSGNIRSAANFVTLMPGVTTGSGGTNNALDARINGGLAEGDEAIGVSLQEGLKLSPAQQKGRPMSEE